MSDAPPRPDRRTITVSETIHLDRSPEAVFDYTQDYATRSDWDPGIKEATILSESPRYEARDNGTEWTQTNSFELKHPRLLGWLAPAFERSLRSSMRQAMGNARSIMERLPSDVRPSTIGVGR